MVDRKGCDCLKLKFIVNDIASLLTNFYICITNNKPSSVKKRSIMELHVKQAILSTYDCMYDDVDDEVWMIDIWDHMNLYTYELNHDVVYDAKQMRDVMNDMQRRLDELIHHPPDTFNLDCELITIRCVPFDGFSITPRDIITLLDIDCM